VCDALVYAQGALRPNCSASCQRACDWAASHTPVKTTPPPPATQQPNSQPPHNNNNTHQSPPTTTPQYPTGSQGKS